MSQVKFTAITSSLLARKGDAVPSTLAAKPSLFWWRANGQSQSAEPPPPVRHKRTGKSPGPPELDKPHKMVVVLTASEFEKLGIAAVKKGVTRHQVVRTALDLHLDRLKCEYAGCTCMTSGGPCPDGFCVL